MKGKQKFIFDEDQETYTVQLKKKKLWWLLLLLLPLLLLLLQIRMHKEVVFKTIDNTSGVVLANANVDFTYPDRNFIDFSTFKFSTYEEIVVNQNTDNQGLAKFEVSYTLFAKLFHKEDETTVVATGGCFQSDTLHPVYLELKDKEEFEIILEARRQTISFTVIDCFDGQPLPNADVTVDFYLGDQKQTIIAKSDPRGIVEANILFCSDKLEINASLYGYKPYSVSGTKDFFDDPQNRILPLEPIMETVSFTVKDLYTKKPVPNATATLVIENNSYTAVTNTNGIGKGMFDSIAIAKQIYIKVSHSAYFDTTTKTYLVEDYVKLSEEQHIIYIRPKAGNLVFKNINKYTNDRLEGVKNEVFINGEKVGDYFSNSYGEFTVPNLQPNDKVSIISTKDGFILNDFTIKDKQISQLKTEKSREIPLEPDLQPRDVSPPVKECRAHFSGTLLSDVYIEQHISLIYSPDKYGEYVGEGEYPSNNIAFPNAVDRTFDAIAVDKGTRVILYSKPNFEGVVLLDVTGPALINNVKWQNDSRIGNFKTATFKEPYESLFPKSCRQWSSEDMNKWSNGSCKVICDK
ncbi:MAG: hypothetical protein JXL97_08735 [Bacteroidales bacterium]|nr:hypothetical protein [Bacteroidales bacterium]